MLLQQTSFPKPVVSLSVLQLQVHQQTSLQMCFRRHSPRNAGLVIQQKKSVMRRMVQYKSRTCKRKLQFLWILITKFIMRIVWWMCNQGNVCGIFCLGGSRPVANCLVQPSLLDGHQLCNLRRLPLKELFQELNFSTTSAA